MSSAKRRKRELVAVTFKPRNPLVALAHARHAGSHAPDRRAERRQARLALKKEDLS
jgi:hypothetical protein